MNLIQNEDYPADNCAISPVASCLPYLFQYTYTSNTEPVKTANLKVIWNGNF